MEKRAWNELYLNRQILILAAQGIFNPQLKMQGRNLTLNFI